MLKPVLLVLVSMDEDGPARCFCSVAGQTRKADVRVQVDTLVGGEVQPERRSVEWRCPDGAILLTEAAQRLAREHGMAFVVVDLTDGCFARGELAGDPRPMLRLADVDAGAYEISGETGDCNGRG